MEGRHVIKQAVFDVTFGAEDDLLEQQSDLGVLVTNRLMRVVDRVFDEMSVGDRVFRIDQLEIDLGAVPYSGYQGELEARLEDRLRAALQEKIASSKAQPGRWEASLTREEYELEQLEFFLLNGRLPWPTELRPGHTINQLLQRVATSNGSRLIDFLRRLPHQPKAVQRLVSQFPDDILAEVAGILWPSSANVAPRLAGDLLKLRRRVGFLEPTDRAFRTEVWCELYTELLSYGSTSSNSARLVERVVGKIALRSDAGSGLLVRLAREASQPGATDRLSPELTRFFQDVSNGAVAETARARQTRPVNRPGTVAHDSPQQNGLTRLDSSSTREEHSANIELLRSRLAEAILHGDAQELRNVWSLVLNQQPELLVEAFHKYGSQVRVRRRLTGVLPNSMLKDLAGLLAPAESRFIQEVTEIPNVFVQALGTLGLQSSVAHRQLWESTLAYLLFASGRHLDKETYIKNLLQQVSDHSHLEYNNVVRAVAAAVKQAKTLTTFPGELPAIVDALAAKVDSGQSALEDVNAESRRVIQSYELYHQVRQHLLELTSEGTVRLSALPSLINQLAQADPGMIIRLCWELLHGDFSWSGTATSAEELSTLVRGLLYINRPPGAAGTSELQDAVDRYAARASDLKGYYRQVLEHLLRGENLDFDVIVASAQTLSENAGLNQSNTEKPIPDTSQGSRPSSVSAEAVETLLGYLSQSGTVSAGETARWIRTFELLLGQQPARLRQLLEPALEAPETAQKIIQVLPERLLTHLLHLLRPSQHSRVQRTADILADACLRLTPSPGLVGGQQLKWQFIFRYVIEEGFPFEERAFTRAFADFIAAETRQPEAAAFRAWLGQQVTRNALPGTAARREAIARALTEPDNDRITSLARSETNSPQQTPSGGEPDLAEDIYIANAGQVLAAPYLLRLFGMLDLTEASAFKDQSAAQRAVHLLQFMVNESTISTEYELVLNKILCGVGLGVPIDREIDITDREREVIEGLIQGMIQNWKTIGNTSVAGFRESFLQRDGTLRLQNDAWHLQVAPRAFDMLLDSIPWSFSTIRLPWMERVIFVEWR